MQSKARQVVAFIVLGLGVCFAYSVVRNAVTSVEVQHLTINVKGTKREYRLVIPHSIRGKVNSPTLIALHGALDTTDEMAEYTQLDALAAEKGFLLVYLQGRLLNWPPNIPDVNPDVAVPDIEFFDAICEHLCREYHAATNRLYLAGVSQGGCMCNLIVAQRSERIAAAVCNCGWMPKPLDEKPLDTLNKCPMLFIAGEHDTQVPAATVRAASRKFEEAGHPIDFMTHAGGHGWNHLLGVNERLWVFLKDKQRSQPDLAQ